MNARPSPPLVESGNDLLPLSRPRELGLPYARRTLGRAIAEGRFPKPVRIGGRLYVTRAALEEFKARLAQSQP